MTDDQFYLVEKKPPIAWVYLNRPRKKNAMNPPAWTETRPIFEKLDQDPDIRAIIIAAKGEAFSAGIDLMAMAGAIPELMEPSQMGGVKRRLVQKISQLQDSFSCIESCRKPVIAAVHGYCIGAGLDLISACDIRLAAADAVFSLREAAIGIVADVGVLQRLPHIVGQGTTRELAFTAKDIDAQRAIQIGLVAELFENRENLWQAAEKMALDIAANAPLAVQAAKQVLNDGIGKSIQSGLDYVAAVSATVIPSKDLTEAITAFMERRKPEFIGE